MRTAQGPFPMETTYGGSWWQWRWSATDRVTLAARSRFQRDAVRSGWDAPVLRAALEAFQPPERLF